MTAPHGRALSGHIFGSQPGRAEQAYCLSTRRAGVVSSHNPPCDGCRPRERLASPERGALRSLCAGRLPKTAVYTMCAHAVGSVLALAARTIRLSGNGSTPVPGLIKLPSFRVWACSCTPFLSCTWLPGLRPCAPLRASTPVLGQGTVPLWKTYLLLRCYSKRRQLPAYFSPI